VGDRVRLYADRDARMAFGWELSGVAAPAASIEKITDAMDAVLHSAGTDERIPRSMLTLLAAEWRDSISMYQPQPSRAGR